MSLKNKVLGLVLISCTQISNSGDVLYPTINPKEELSISENELATRSSDERSLIDFTFFPTKQTGQNQIFQADELKKIEVEDFEPHNLVKILYPFDNVEIKDVKFPNSSKKIFNFLESKYYEKCDCVGGKKLVEQNIFVRQQKVIEFKNIQKEKRFLLPIEVWEVYGTGLDTLFTKPKLEMYLFKKIENNHYQLVTRTPVNYEAIGLYEGSGKFPSESSLKDVASNIRLIGDDRIGSFFKIHEVKGGVSFADWNILSLKEDEFIRSYLISNASEDNSGMLYTYHPYKYESKLTFLPSKGESYFPIKIQYTGNKFFVSSDKLEDKNQTNILEFDPRLRIYSYDRKTMQRVLLEESIR